MAARSRRPLPPSSPSQQNNLCPSGGQKGLGRPRGSSSNIPFDYISEVFHTQKLWKTYTHGFLCRGVSCADKHKEKKPTMISAIDPGKNDGRGEKKQFSALDRPSAVSSSFSYSTVSASGEIRSKGNLFLLLIFLGESDRCPTDKKTHPHSRYQG